MAPPAKTSPSTSLDPMRVPLRLLASLAQTSMPLSVDDLTLESGTTFAMAQEAVRALEAEGLIVPDSTGDRYVVGPRFLSLVKTARMNFRLEHELRPLLRELANASGETVTFNTYDRGATACVCLMVEQSPAPLHYVVEVGEQKPLHAGASGRAILAVLSPQEIDSYIARTGLPPVTPRTTTDPAMLRRELAKARKQGYALTRGQRLDGAVALAAATTFGGSPSGSVVITIPAHRFRPANREMLAAHVMDTARRISLLLEGRSAA